ncbi:hypothetical protein [Tetrastichus brontispae RNA virus 1]|nr:hypothetical protein [Tetrastichus brontispae RNA virus 1]
MNPKHPLLNPKLTRLINNKRVNVNSMINCFESTLPETIDNLNEIDQIQMQKTPGNWDLQDSDIESDDDCILSQKGKDFQLECDMFDPKSVIQSTHITNENHNDKPGSSRKTIEEGEDQQGAKIAKDMEKKLYLTKELSHLNPSVRTKLEFDMSKIKEEVHTEVILMIQSTLQPYSQLFDLDFKVNAPSATPETNIREQTINHTAPSIETKAPELTTLQPTNVTTKLQKEWLTKLKKGIKCKSRSEENEYYSFKIDNKNIKESDVSNCLQILTLNNKEEVMFNILSLHPQVRQLAAMFVLPLNL